MSAQDVKLWVEIVAAAGTVVVGAVAALWAYTKFIVERGLLPPTQFDVECNPVGEQGDKLVVEILLHLKNLGSAALIARNIRTDVRYVLHDDPAVVFGDSTKPTFGRLRFEHSLRQELERQARSEINSDRRGLLIVPYSTFVQPGVDQIYTYVTAVDQRATYALVWSSFEYAQNPSRLQRVTLRAARRLGLIQYSLTHVQEPHTIERAFSLQRSPRPPPSLPPSDPRTSGPRPPT